MTEQSKEVLLKEYNDFVDSLNLGDIHIRTFEVGYLNERKEWLRTIKNNIGKLERKLQKVYDAYTLELEKYVRGIEK